MSATDGVIRRKVNTARVDLHEGGPGADRGWRLALARAARDQLKTALEVTSLALARVSLAEVLEMPPERALLAVLEGPGDGLGVLVISPEVLQAMTEMLTIGRIAPASATPRRATRTDAAMIAPLIDAALGDLDLGLAQEADLIWAGGWRYASFLDDPRPLGLMLEDVSYRLLRAEVDLAHGARQGSVMLALPAEGRGRLPHRPSVRPLLDEASSHRAFAEGLAQEVEAAECRLDAVLTRLALSLGQVVGLAVGDVLPLAAASLDRVSIEGLDGRRMAEGKLGQNRGMRAMRLSTGAGAGSETAAPSLTRHAGGLPSETVPTAINFRHTG